MPEDDSVPDSRILVMEDDNSLRALFVEVMELEGHAADGARSLDEARQLLDANQYAVFLCDMQIGHERSLDLVREVQARPDGPEVVMISGTAQYEMYLEEMGVEFFLVKPVEIDVLIHLISRLTASDVQPASGEEETPPVE